MRKLAIALTMLALGHAETAQAQDGHYSVDGATVRVPAPAGYCSEGKMVDSYMANQRSINPSVVPDIVMMRCGAKELTFDFFAVRVVPRAPATTLKAFLDELRRTMPAAQAAPSLVSPSQTEALNKRLSDALAANATIRNEIRPIGVDDTCGYVAGLIHFEVAGSTADDAAIVGCATVIAGHPVYLFRYQPGTDREKAVAAMPELKALALAATVEK